MSPSWYINRNESRRGGGRILGIALSTLFFLIPATSLAAITQPLSFGSRGTQVTELQTYLSSKGYFAGPVSGVYGALTKTAVAEFQKAHGITPFGVVGPQTIAILGSSNSANTSSAPVTPSSLVITRQLKLGSTGSDVLQLQQFLQSQGFSIPSATGYFGTQTAAAVSAFQAAHGIPSAGQVGPQTRNLIASLVLNTTTTTSSRSSASVKPVVTSNGSHSIGGGGGGSNSYIPVPTPAPDTTAPVISSVLATTTTTTTAVSWTTDESATSEVDIGTTTAYGTASTSAALSTSHSILLSGLTPSTTYHFRIQSADSSGNIATTTDQVLTTASVPIIVSIPTVTTSAATSITATSSILNGAISADGNASSTVRGFQFGTSTSYGLFTTTHNGTFGTGTFSTSTIPYLTLTASSTYHFRAYATNTAGTGYGADQTFVTSAAPVVPPPVISSISASPTSSSTATIMWTTDTLSNSQVYFGLTTGYGASSTSATTTTSHILYLTGLTASSTYHYYVSSTNSASSTATSSDATFTTPSYNLYVDSVNGNDSNNGLTPNSALKNITAIPTITSGMKIGLANGSYWRQMLNIATSSTPVTNVLVSGYGTGTQPILDASDNIATSTWTKTSGLTYTYQTGTLTFPGTYGIGVPNISVFENGNYLAYVTSTSTVDSTAGSFTVTNMSGASGQIYVHTTNGTNPGLNGLTYEYTSRPDGLYLSCSGGCSVNGITFKRAGGNDGPVRIIGDGSNPIVNNITCVQGTRHCVTMAAGTIQNSTFNDIYDPATDGSASMLVFYESTGSGIASYSINNIFNYGSTNSSTTVASANEPSAATWHTGTGNLGNIAFSNNQINGSNGYTVGGFGGSNSPSWNVSGGTFLETHDLIGTNAGQTITVSGIKQKTSNLSQSFFANLGSGGSLNVSNSLFCLANINQGIFRNTSAGNATLSIASSTFYAQSTQNNSVSMLFDIAGSLSWSVNGSTIDTTQHGGSWAWNGNSTGETYTGNNNSFPGIARWTLNNNTYNSLSAWQASTTQDTNSTTTGSGISACT